jgi:hypothetical protein
MSESSPDPPALRLARDERRGTAPNLIPDPYPVCRLADKGEADDDANRSDRHGVQEPA